MFPLFTHDLNTNACQRCGDKTTTKIMSKFNEEMICTGGEDSCKSKEAKHPLYKLASEMELKEVQAGNYNFKGIGKPNDL